MTYLAQSQMTRDPELIGRIAGCVATLGVRDAEAWARSQMWLLSASPGWSTRYREATETEPQGDPAAHVPTAGADSNVITDDMILEAVSAALAAERSPQQPL